MLKCVIIPQFALYKGMGFYKSFIAQKYEILYL